MEYSSITEIYEPTPSLKTVYTTHSQLRQAEVLVYLLIALFQTAFSHTASLAVNIEGTNYASTTYVPATSGTTQPKLQSLTASAPTAPPSPIPNMASPQTVANPRSTVHHNLINHPQSANPRKRHAKKLNIILHTHSIFRWLNLLNKRIMHCLNKRIRFQAGSNSRNYSLRLVATKKSSLSRFMMASLHIETTSHHHRLKIIMMKPA